MFQTGKMHVLETVWLLVKKKELYQVEIFLYMTRGEDGDPWLFS